LLTEVSATTIDDLIRSWKRAILRSDAHALGYPPVNTIKKAMDYGEGRGPSRSDFVPYMRELDEETDVAYMNLILGYMHWRVDAGITADYYSPFIAYHLGVIRNESCRHLPHKARALILGLKPTTYHERVRRGWEFIRDWVSADYLSRTD